MAIIVQEHIAASREQVWQLISNPDAWENMISGIVAVEVIERPAAGMIGLKWQEKRIMFGKEALETMWITAAEANHFYETTAHNHGMIYRTRMSLEDADGGTDISMEFSAEATTLGAKLMSPIAALFNGTLRKALQKDLADIKQAAERTDA